MIPDALKKILEPLIHELKEQNETLTSEEFLMACEHVYQVYMNLLKFNLKEMPIIQKNEIYDFYFNNNRRRKSSLWDEGLTFHVRLYFN